MTESLPVSPLSIAFSPFPVLFLPLINLNPPSGENRRPPQSGTNCFVQFTNPEPNLDKRSLVKGRCVICLCQNYILRCYQIIYCAVVLQLWVPGGPGASQRIKAVTNAVGTNEISPSYR